MGTLSRVVTRLSYRMIVPRYPIFFDRLPLGEIMRAWADFRKEEPQGWTVKRGFPAFSRRAGRGKKDHPRGSHNSWQKRIVTEKEKLR